MKIVYSLIFISMASCAMNDNENKNSQKSDCDPCQTYSHEEILRVVEWKSATKLHVLALTCHEYSEDEIRQKAEKIWLSDLDCDKKLYRTGTNDHRGGSRGYNYGTAERIINVKLQAGCNAPGCTLLLAMINEFREKQKQEREMKRRMAEQVRLKKVDEDYRNLLDKQ